jgi:hypothetical protein
MTAPDREFVREHHVHYEVEPEEVVAPDHREVTGYRVRLFATHGDEKLPDPACPRCHELRSDLQAFARGLVPPDGEGDPVEIVAAAAPRIYASREVPGADEVQVTVRVLCSSPGHRSARSPEEGCLAPIAERLSRLGVPRR